MKHVSWFRCLLFTLLLLWNSATVLASAPAGQVDWHDQLIAERQTVIIEWNRQAELQELMIIAVIVFGAAVTVLQSWSARPCKVATVILGAAVSVFTGIDAKVFQSDYRSLRASAIEGKNLLDHLNVVLVRYDSMAAEDRATLDAEFIKGIDQFDQLRKKVLQPSSPTVAALRWIPSAYAGLSMDTPPFWVIEPPSDPFSLYYVGFGQGPSLAAAKAASVNRAVARAAEDLARKAAEDLAQEAAKNGLPVEIDLEVVKEFVKGAATIVNSDFRFQGSNTAGSYKYYTLLRLSRTSLDVVKQLAEMNWAVRRNIRPK